MIGDIISAGIVLLIVFMLGLILWDEFINTDADAERKQNPYL